MNILDEIKKLPNLGYEYYGVDGKEHIVVLGGESCPSSDEYRFSRSISYYNLQLIDLYTNKPFSQETKDTIAYYMKKMRSSCDSRMTGTYTLEQQSKYIDELSPDERQQIAEQVQMYKEYYAIYLESLRWRYGDYLYSNRYIMGL